MSKIELHFPRYERYKPSEIDWINQIPSHWETKALKHIAKLQSGDTIRPEEFTEDGYPVFGGNGFRGYTKSFNNVGRFPLIGRQGALCGNVNYSSGHFFASEHAVVVYPRTECSVTWLGETIRAANFNRLSQSTAQPGISVAVVGNQKFPCPPVLEKKAIAKFIDQKSTQIEQAIQIKERQIERLKERKQILIQHAVTRGLDPNAPMRDSGIEWIGETPAHWSIKRAKYLFREVDERSPDGQQELLSVSHLTGVTPRSEKNVTMFMSEDYTGSKTCQKDDLIFNIMWAWMGALGVSDRAGIVSSAYGIYRQLQPGTLNSQYLELLLKTTAYIAHYNKVSTGLHSSRLRFYGHMFMAMEIGFPDREEQDALVEYLDFESGKLNKAVDLLEQQIIKLKEYRATLINSAVTGKIRVPGVVESAELKEREFA
ncbi:restriction endonuclease subunit S [Pseudomonas viridiflava]|uniref:restriction endonuclease subunit S n=1 Tax=Pseudomonas viridiflava TaxID=33069 RepID=UPI000F026570|nr:restriction endonuclease subunit S [Pseudomonas viridiflava]